MLKTFSGSLGSRAKLPAILRPDPNAPQPVRQAVKWIYAGAALSALTLVLTVISAFSLIGLKNSLMVQYAQELKDNKVTVSQINTFVSDLDQQTIEGIVIGVVMIALWTWMGKMNGTGQRWARITATVFFALWTIDSYLVVNSLKAGVFVTGWQIVSLVMQLALWIIGVASIALLYRPVSTAYFKAQSEPVQTGSTRPKSRR